MQTTTLDPHTQLRSIYVSLLTNQERFDEFKQLLGLYTGVDPEASDAEPEDARAVRSVLNARVREWTGLPLEELSVAQVLQWRTIIVEERINIAISPWKESNQY